MCEVLIVTGTQVHDDKKSEDEHFTNATVHQMLFALCSRNHSCQLLAIALALAAVPCQPSGQQMNFFPVTQQATVAAPQFVSVPATLNLPLGQLGLQTGAVPCQVQCLKKKLRYKNRVHSP